MSKARVILRMSTLTLAWLLGLNTATLRSYSDELTLPSRAIAQLPTAAPAAIGVSAERLDRVTAYLQELVDKDQVSGGVIMMARHGRVVLHEAIGMMDREQQTPMRKDAIFRIASMTKPITSVAVMMLVEEGKIGLDDPLSKYIPEFANPKVMAESKRVQAKKEITIRDLLRHTSGLTYDSHEVLGPLHRQAGINGGIVTEPKTLEEMMGRLAELPLAFHPGEQWHYGMSTDVLGRVVEVASKMPLDEFFQTRIFEPLGMEDTHFRVPTDKVSRITTPYYFDQDGSLQRQVDGKADYPFDDSHRYQSGGGSLCSTASDYMRFCQMLANNGSFDGEQLLTRETVAMMATNQVGQLSHSLKDQIPGYGDQKVGFGFGFLVVLDDPEYKQLSGSYQWYGAFSTSFCIVPKRDWTLVALLQTAWHDNSIPWAEELKRRAAAAVID